MEVVSDFDFVAALIEIIFIDLILSGDNAVVIALASQHLPADARRVAIIFGTGVAIFLRVFFTTVISFMLTVPYLRLAGAVVLAVIAIKLTLPQDDPDEDVEKASSLWAAVRVIAIADLIMSLDNVVAIAAASDGSFMLLAIGLLLSMPLLFYGSTLIAKLIARFPILIIGCGGLLGWVAGQIGATDPIVVAFVHDDAPEFSSYAPILGLVLVMGGSWIIRRNQSLDAAEQQALLQSAQVQLPAPTETIEVAANQEAGAA